MTTERAIQGHEDWHNWVATGDAKAHASEHSRITTPYIEEAHRSQKVLRTAHGLLACMRLIKAAVLPCVEDAL